METQAFSSLSSSSSPIDFKQASISESSSSSTETVSELGIKSLTDNKSSSSLQTSTTLNVSLEPIVSAVIDQSSISTKQTRLNRLQSRINDPRIKVRKLFDEYNVVATKHGEKITASNIKGEKIYQLRQSLQKDYEALKQKSGDEKSSTNLIGLEERMILDQIDVNERAIKKFEKNKKSLVDKSEQISKLYYLCEERRKAQRGIKDFKQITRQMGSFLNSMKNIKVLSKLDYNTLVNVYDANKKIYMALHEAYKNNKSKEILLEREAKDQAFLILSKVKLQLDVLYELSK